MNNTANRFLQFTTFFAQDLPLPMDILADLMNIPREELTETLLEQGIILQLPVGMILNTELENLSAPTQELAEQTAEAVITRLEKALRNHNKVKQLAAFQAVGPHLVTLIEKLTPFELNNLWEIHSLMARYLMLVGKAEQASSYFSQAVEFYPQQQLVDDEILQELTLQFAEAESAAGNFVHAAELVEKAIADEIKTEGLAKPTTIIQLAHIAYREEDYAKAITLYLQAIQLEQETSGDENLIASHWNNLGRIYLSAHDVEKAIESFSTALNFWKTIPSTEHHINQALALKNLALAYQQQGNLSTAQTTIEEAIMLSEKEYGEDHPDIGRDANIYALILQEQGLFEAALEQFRRALRIDIRSFGQNHPEIALTLNNMGALYAEMGRLDAAEQNLLDAQAILQRCSSEDHPYWRQVEENIARLGE